MIIRAVLVLIVLAAASDRTGASTQSDLTCPVREDWSGDADECLCQVGWKPTPEQLKQILATHQAWIEHEGWKDPSISGRANLCSTNLEDANFRNERLRGADLRHADLRYADLRYADLRYADLQGAILFRAGLQGANLAHADLLGAILFDAVLQGANLEFAFLQRADLEDADLEGANVEHAYLRDARVIGTDVANARFAFAILSSAVYAPASPPPDGHLEGISGLATVTFPPGQQSGLVQLRELLRRAGLRDLERQATFAIEHNKARHARCEYTLEELAATFRSQDQCVKVNSPAVRIGGWLQLVFFEWTTGWGLYPDRALLIMLGLIIFLGVFVYPSPIAAAPSHASQRHGIVRIWSVDEYGSPEGRVKEIDQVEIQRLSANIPWVFTWGLWFSVLSAFHIGWRDLNVGTWLSRLQPFPFALRPRGWVRVVSGLQALCSVYLVAIWALTYFGRPFQ